jgi:hypothetical protein
LDLFPDPDLPEAWILIENNSKKKTPAGTLYGDGLQVDMPYISVISPHLS